MAFERKRLKKVLLGLLFVTAFSLRIVLWPTVAAGMLVGILAAAGCLSMSPWQWLLAAPVLYYVWLLLLLSLYALETGLVGRWITKPRRLVIYEDKKLPLVFAVIMANYSRLSLLVSLPGTKMFGGFPVFRWLYLRAYSPKVHLGSLSSINGILNDPELTYIGRGAIVGGDSRLVAHSITRNSKHEIVLHTAPIRIERFATIGGFCQVEMGVVIGAYALIEPCSHVIAFTKIPRGEVWGGVPAVFKRKRDDMNAPLSSPVSIQVKSDSVEAVLRLTALALHVPEQKVTADTQATDLIEWDSIGKMSIAAALHDRFGVSLEPEEQVQLKSIPAILEAIERHAKPAGVKKNEPLPAAPELLPLLDPGETTTALAAETPGFRPQPQSKLRICVAASFVAEPLASALKLWCSAFGIEADIAFAGFNQIQAELLSPGSLFQRNREGLNIVLTRPEDLAGLNPGDAVVAARQLLASIRQFSATAGSSLVIADLPPAISTRFTGDKREAEAVRNLWRDEMATLPQVATVDFSAIIEELGATASRDEAMELEASTPYRPAVYQRLGIAIARLARRVRVPRKKVMAVDADGVLWGGVVGEDGPKDLKTDGAHRQLQLRLKAWKDSGILLVLVSRNEAEDVWAAFEAHPEMPLKREDFSGFRINWNPKSKNIRELAHDLNLGLDSFVFIDDNPGEQIEVQGSCPEVTVVPFKGGPAMFVSMLERLWCFDAASTTAEDSLRTEFMQQEVERKALAASPLPYEEYLRSLELRVEVRPAQAADFARVAQLTQKTNQFNLSLRRRTLAEIETLAVTHRIFIVSAKDRFGDYGTVGVGILKMSDGDKAPAFLDSFLLSCRALGRGVEEIFLHSLGQMVTKHQGAHLLAPYVLGPRNEPIRAFLLKQAFTVNDEDHFVVSLSELPSPPSHVHLELMLT